MMLPNRTQANHPVCTGLRSQVNPERGTPALPRYTRAVAMLHLPLSHFTKRCCAACGGPSRAGRLCRGCYLGRAADQSATLGMLRSGWADGECRDEAESQELLDIQNVFAAAIRPYQEAHRRSLRDVNEFLKTQIPQRAVPAAAGS